MKLGVFQKLAGINEHLTVTINSCFEPRLLISSSVKQKYKT